MGSPRFGTESNKMRKEILVTRSHGRWKLFATDKESLKIARLAYTILLAVFIGLLPLAGRDIGFLEGSIHFLIYAFCSWLLLYLSSMLFFQRTVWCLARIDSTKRKTSTENNLIQQLVSPLDCDGVPAILSDQPNVHETIYL